MMNSNHKYIISLSYSYIDSDNLDFLIEISDPYKLFNMDNTTIIMFYKNDFPNKTEFVNVIEEITGKNLDEFKK